MIKELILISAFNTIPYSNLLVDDFYRNDEFLKKIELVMPICQDIYQDNFNMQVKCISKLLDVI